MGLLPSTGRKRGSPPAQPAPRQPAQESFWPGVGSGSRSDPVFSTPQPQYRSYLVRGFYTLFWPVAFFIAAGLTMSALAGSFTAETEALQKQIQQQSAQQHGSWVFLASLLLFVLGCVGLLPWTGRMKKG
jgi:hypothetical protein